MVLSSATEGNGALGEAGRAGIDGACAPGRRTALGGASKKSAEPTQRQVARLWLVDADIAAEDNCRPDVGLGVSHRNSDKYRGTTQRVRALKTQSRVKS